MILYPEAFVLFEVINSGIKSDTPLPVSVLPLLSKFWRGQCEGVISKGKCAHLKQRKARPWLIMTL
ncbi:MAG: hypothetical protein AAF478_10460 [Pseudomonadota bacterium]